MRHRIVTIALLIGRLLSGQTPVPIHPLGPVVAAAALAFKSVEPGQVISLADGRVLVADGGARIVWLFDRSLANPLRVLDSLPGKNTTFSSGSLLLPYRGDTTLIFDRAASAIVTIHPDGTLGRAFATPPVRAISAAVVASAATAGRAPPAPTVPGFTDYFALPTTSAAFGFVYRIQFPASIALRMSGAPRLEDSMYVVRMEFTSRRVDTLARLASGPVFIHLGGFAFSFARPTFPNQPKRRPELLPFSDETAVTGVGISIDHRQDRAPERGRQADPDERGLRLRQTTRPWR